MKENANNQKHKSDINRYKEGYDIGYREGYVDGYREGYDSGYRDGINMNRF